MSEKYSLLNHKVEQTHNQVKKIEAEMKDLTIKVSKHDDRFKVVDRDIADLGDKKASIHHVNDKTGGILLLNKHIDDLEVNDKIQSDKIAENTFNIEKLSYKIDNTVSSVNKLVVKLDNMTTPKTIGIIMGAVVAFCGFVLGVVKLLNMV